VASSVLPAPLTIDERRGLGRISLVLDGELDLSGTRHLAEHLAQLRRTYRGRLVLDLRGLTWVDSSALGVLISADAYARQDGWVLEIVPGAPEIQRVFARCGLLDQLPFRTS
jgi:anti-anti-sigma factor